MTGAETDQCHVCERDEDHREDPRALARRADPDGRDEGRKLLLVLPRVRRSLATGTRTMK